MIIIPAIDFLNNRVVRLKKGEFKQVDYFTETPRELLDRVPLQLNRLHFVNLSGALRGSQQDQIQFFKGLFPNRFTVQFGGGIRDQKDLEILKEIGVSKIVLGSLWVQDLAKAQSLTRFWGAENVIAALDVLGTEDTRLRTHGWTTISDQKLEAVIPNIAELGVNEFLVTSIDRDGMMNGPNIELYQKINPKNDFNIIASGGVRNWDDIQKLETQNIHACVVGRAWLEDVQFFKGIN